MRTQGVVKIILAGARVLVKNVLLLVLGVWVLVTLVFLYLYLYLVLSGRDLEIVYTSGLPPGAREEVKRDLGLDRPSLVRVYGAYWTQFLTGGWGFSSIYYPRTVVDLLGERLPRSLLLLGTALIAGLGLSRLLARLMDRGPPGLGVASRLGTLALATLPLPLAVLLPAYGLSHRLGWLPFGQTLDPLLWRTYPNTSLDGVLWGVVVAFALGLLTGASLFSSIRRKMPPPWPVLLGGGIGAAGATLTLLGILGERLPLGLDLLRHLALPWLTLTLYAGAWHALLLRDDFLPQRFGEARRGSLGPWALYLSLMLTLLPAVEATYNWLGLGPLVNRALSAADLPLLQGLGFTGIGLLALGILAQKTRQDLCLVRSSSSSSSDSSPSLPPADGLGGSSRTRYLRTAYKVGFLGLLLFVSAAAVHPLLLETVWDPKIYDPLQGTDPRVSAPAPPSREHPLGTDRSGRDVLSALMGWIRRTLWDSALPAGIGAALLGLGLGRVLRLLEPGRTAKRRLRRFAPRGLIGIAYAPLALPFLLLLGQTAVLRWPLPSGIEGVLLALPWAFHVLRSSLERGSPGKGSRGVTLLGAAVCYGTGALLLRSTLQLPEGISLEPRLLQDPFREGWLFWPDVLVRWLLPFSTFSWGWALSLYLYLGLGARGPSPSR